MALVVASLVASVLAAVPPSVSAQTDPPAQAEPAPKGDIVFVVDESGSMGPDIADVRARIGDVIAQLDAAGVDARIGVVGYSGGNRIYTPLTDDPAAITAGVGMLAANKPNPEAGFSATVTAMSDAMGFRDDAASCEVLISDEDADVTTAYPQTKAQALAALDARDAGFFAVVTTGGNSEFDYGPQPASLAAETLGGTFDLLAFRADAGPVLEGLIDDCITKIQSSQPLRVDAGPDVSTPEGSVVTLDGSATSSVQGIEDRGRFTVSAQSNIFAAGLTAPTGAGGVLPVEVDAMVPGTAVTFSGASGTTYTSSSCTGTAYPPDGTGSSTSVGATGGISGLVASDRQMLVGVFTTDTAPSAPAPVRLDFAGTRTEFENLRPQVGQTFFVGDGLSPTGLRHSFEVPPGATRLFLGLVGTNYTSFCGSYEINVATSTGPAPITYRWELLSAAGPPIQLSSTAAADPSFAVFDDGTYQLRLTATDGVETASDQTTVTVTNQNPVIATVESDAAATDGLVEITTTYSDPGPFDTHNLSIDWGDGTPLETVPVQAGGTGWGYGYAGHRYAALGTPTVTVTVVDDNGGVSAPQTVIVDVGGAGQGEPNPTRPAALFAAATSGADAIRVSGSGNSIAGLSHSNAGIRVSGSGHSFVGGTEYATTLTVQGSGSTFDPPAVQAPTGGFPFEFVWADYQPGGRAALAAGAAYHPIPASACNGGKWKPATPLTAGLYVVPCGVQISGSDVAGDVTIVATGDIKVSGSGDSFVPFIDGLLFYSTSTGSRAVDLAGSGHSFDGAMFAPAGGIEVTGSGNHLGCGIMGQTARISGSNNQIAGVDCRGAGGGEGTTVSIAAPPVVVPTLDLTLAADKATALPGETITYTNTLRNGLTDPAAPGSTSLLVPALVGVDNHDTAPVTVGEVVYTFEVHDAVTGEWRTWATTDPAAPAEQRHVTFTGRPTPTTGVTYAPEGFTGTVVDPGAIGSWASAAVISLTGDQATAILDPARIDAVRNTITIATDRPLVRKLTRFDDDPLGAIRTPPAADTTNNTIVLTRPAGNPVTFDTTAVPELALLAPGAAATGTATAVMPQPEPAAAGETDSAYLARLDTADGQALFGAAYGTGTARVGGLFATQQLAATAVQVPIVTPHLAVPTQVAAGTPIPISLTLTNTGSTTATDVTAVVDVAGHGTVTLTGLPAELAPGATATGTATIATTAGATTTYATTATITWSHPGGAPGLYGPLHPTATTVAKPPVALDVVKYDNPDVIEDGIDYVIVATNTGTNPLTGVTVVDPIDPNATLIAGTATTTTGTITTGTDPADRTVTVDVGTLAPGAQAVIGLQVDYTLAAPDTTEITNQATVTTVELGDIVSDDPSEPGTADANVTPITPPNPGPGTGGGGPGGANNGPTLQDCDPADGATITAPTDLACTLNPRDGTTITEWTAYLIPIGGTAEEAVPIATGTGPDVTGQLDPTIVDNGIWNITIIADDDQNGRSILDSSIIVDGRLKLGRFSITYQDMAVPVGGIPIQVMRTYDTLDRNHQGDFGYGWTLDLSNFRVQANRPLGDRGWEQYDCGVAVFIVTKCYRTNRPHYVTVTWPNGRTETFDLTPAESPPAFNFLTQVEYTGRPGTTSTLEPAPGDEWAMFIDNGNGDSNLYKPLTADLYQPTRYTLVARDGTRYLLDTTTGLVTATDRDGNTVTVSDNGIESSDGPGITFNRDTDGRITSIVGPDNQTITYQTDPAGDLTQVTNANGFNADYTYTGDHFLTGASGAATPATTYGYDADGRLTSVTTNGGTTNLTPDIDARTQVVTSPDGRLTSVSTYSDLGDVTRQDQTFDSRTLTSTATWNDRGQPLTIIDPLGHTTTATYNDQGDLTRLVKPDGLITETTFTQLGQPIDVTIGGELRYHHTYDTDGHLLSSTRTGEGTTTFDYDDRGRVDTITDPLGRTLAYTYESGGVIDAVTTPTGTVNYDYDASRRATAVTDQASNTTRSTYDDEGNLTSVTDANGNTQRWTYNQYNQVAQATDKASRTTIYTYDTFGQLTGRVDRNNQQTTWTYSASGQLLTETTPTTTTTWAYDPLDRPTTIANNDAVITLTWDDASELVAETTTGTPSSPRPTVTVDYTLDPAGRPLTINGLGTTTTNHYDNLGRVDTISGDDIGTITFGYDPAGRLATLTRPNGANDTYQYDNASQLLSIHTTKDGTDLAIADYHYNPAGLRDEYTTLEGTHTYTYDDLGQLTGADHPTASGIPDETYTYDPVGRRTSSSDNPSGTITYDNADRLQGDAASAYSYDNEGNRTQRRDRLTGDTTTYQWNTLHQLTTITEPDGTTTNYRYDGLGRRIETNTDGAITRYAYDGANLRHALDAQGDPTATYTTHPVGYDGILATVAADGTVTYPVTDALGTTTETLDAIGSIASAKRFDSYGIPIGNTPVGEAFAWTGLSVDSSGLVFARARMYDPLSGQFLSEDAIHSQNRYLYAANSPVMLTDPSGLIELLSEAKLDEEQSVASEESGKQAGCGTAAQLYRFGIEWETLEALATQAAAAEAKGFPHGISAFSRSTRPDAVSALREEVEQYFRVIKTGKNPSRLYAMKCGAV